jgi:hypothetical protein
VCGYPTSDTPRAEGIRAIRTAFSRNSPTSVSSNRDRTSPPPNTPPPFIDKTLECSLLANVKAAAGAAFARKTLDRHAPDRPTPTLTPRPQPKPKPPPRNNAETKDPKPKNTDRNA